MGPLPSLLLLTFLATGCIAPRVQFVDLGADAPGPTPERAAVGSEVVVVGPLHAETWGVHLFSDLPVVTGGLDRDGRPDRRWFEDTVRVATLVELLRAEAHRRGATHLVDLTSDWRSDWVGATLIFWTRETQASATAVRCRDEPPEGAIPVGAPEHRSAVDGAGG
jgi:hypothetical protein